MRFDDRLMTVLDQPATDPHDRAVRWRQLVDLVARARGEDGNPLIDDALKVIREDRAHVDQRLRAAAARAIAALPVPYDLISLFASDGFAVSAPILAAASLDARQWRGLMDIADQETRNFIQTLHPEALELAEEEAAQPAEPVPPPDRPSRAPAPSIPSISDVVARIERVRRSAERERPPPEPISPSDRLSSPALFRWECGPSGEIGWVEGAPRGPIVGRSIARAEEGEGVDDEVERAFALRAPFRDADLVLPGDGPVAGAWKISGVPAFEPTDGRFAGYRGIALRDSPALADSLRGGPRSPVADPDSLRELVHEIKTPLNAIIGFAEIIDQQYLGPANRAYRERAAVIVAEARLLLSAIDDLDFAAKLQAARDRPGSGTDLGMLLEQIAAAMRQGAVGDAPSLELVIEARRRRCSLEPALAERLVTRFCSALLSGAADGQRVQVHLDHRPGQCLLWATQSQLPRAATDDAKLTFGLRLVRGLARIAGGDLTTSRGRITLALPEL